MNLGLSMASGLIASALLLAPAGAARADAMYELSADPGQTAFDGTDTPQSTSGSDPVNQSITASSAGACGTSDCTRSTSQTASVTGSGTTPGVSSNGSLDQSGGTSNNYDTFANTNATEVNIYEIVMTNSAGSGITSVPVIITATGSFSLADNSEGSVGATAQVSYGTQSDQQQITVQEICGFDGTQTTCTFYDSDNGTETSFDTTIDAAFGVGTPFGLQVGANGFDQAQFPDPGNNSYSDAASATIEIDPDFAYADDFAIIEAPSQEGGPVPEPASALLFAGGLAALALRRRRRA